MSSTLRIPIAMAASVIVLVSAKTSFAQEAENQTPPATSSTTTTTMTSPAAPPPVTQPTSPPPVSTTTTTQAQYNEAAGGERFTERSIEHRPNRTLLGIGSGLFVLTYGASIVAGAVSDRDEDNKLFIPVVGPWLDLGQRDCTARGCGSSEDTAKAMIITSGIVQGAGVLLALGSLVIPESTTVEERTITANAKKPEKPSVRVLPLSFGAGAGVGAVGRF